MFVYVARASCASTRIPGRAHIENYHIEKLNASDQDLWVSLCKWLTYIHCIHRVLVLDAHGNAKATANRSDKRTHTNVQVIHETLSLSLRISPFYYAPCGPHEVTRFTTYVTPQLRLDALPSPRLNGRGGLLHTVCRAVHKMKDYCWMTCVFGFVRRLPLPPLQHLHNNLFKTLSTMSRCRSALQTLAGMNASSMVTAIVDYQQIYAKSATIYISWCL